MYIKHRTVQIVDSTEHTVDIQLLNLCSLVMILFVQVRLSTNKYDLDRRTMH